MPRYVTPQQIVVYYDKRRLLQLLTDDGTEATEAQFFNPLTPAGALADSLIRAVESEIDACLQVGSMYTRADLEAIITAAESVGASEAEKKRAAMLQRLAADLFYGTLVARRGFAADTLAEMAPRFVDAQQTLAALADGDRVFDLGSKVPAGLPQSVKIGAQIDNTIRNSRLFGIFDPRTTQGWY